MHDFFPNHCTCINLSPVNVTMHFSISSHSLRNSIGSEKHPRDFSSYSANTLIQHEIKLEIYVSYEHNNADTCLT